MTKAEKQNLKNRKCLVEKDDGLYTVQFSLTEGELLALNNALTNYGSPVGEDVKMFLQNAAYRVGITL